MSGMLRDGCQPHADDRIDEPGADCVPVRGRAEPSANERSKSAHVCIIRLRAMMLRSVTTGMEGWEGSG